MTVSLWKECQAYRPLQRLCQYYLIYILLNFHIKSSRLFNIETCPNPKTLIEQFTFSVQPKCALAHIFPKPSTEWELEYSGIVPNVFVFTAGLANVDDALFQPVISIPPTPSGIVSMSPQWIPKFYIQLKSITLV